MAAQETMQVGDVGTVLRITIEEDGAAVDISGASSKQILLEKPDTSLLTKTASFTTTGVDGKIQYTTITGDIDQDGDWRIQAKVVIGTSTFYSTVKTIPVLPNVPL